MNEVAGTPIPGKSNPCAKTTPIIKIKLSTELTRADCAKSGQLQGKMPTESQVNSHWAG